MTRTSRTGLIILAVIIFVAVMKSPDGINPGHSDMTQAADASESGIVAERRESHESELQQLLMERKRLLTCIVQSMKFFLEAGRVGIDEYRDANIALLRAEMDLCETRNDRLKILEKIVQFHTTCEAWVEKRAAEGHATQIDVDRAKVARLQAQIELIRKKLKGQSPEWQRR